MNDCSIVFYSTKKTEIPAEQAEAPPSETTRNYYVESRWSFFHEQTFDTRKRQIIIRVDFLFKQKDKQKTTFSTRFFTDPDTNRKQGPLYCFRKDMVKNRTQMGLKADGKETLKNEYVHSLFDHDFETPSCFLFQGLHKQG